MSMPISTTSAGGRSASVRRDRRGFWVVRSPAEARIVLETDDWFRLAKPEEFIPGLSRSFFLATDFGSAETGRHCRAALVAYAAPAHLRELAARRFRDIADRVCARAGCTASPDLSEDLLRPYGRHVAYHLAGLPAGAGRRLIATVRVAGARLGNDPADPYARRLYGEVVQELRGLAEDMLFDAHGLPGYALRCSLVDAFEAALLALPIIEMAAFDMNVALAKAAIDRILALGPPDATQLRAFVLAAAADVPDIRVTRVAIRPGVLGGQSIATGELVLVEVSAANRLLRALHENLAFGRGAHVCLGRELAVQIAVSIIEALTRHALLDCLRENG